MVTILKYKNITYIIVPTSLQWRRKNLATKVSLQWIEGVGSERKGEKGQRRTFLFLPLKNVKKDEIGVRRL